MVQWFLYPVVMFEAVKWLDLRTNYLRYIAAYNWINLPLVAMILVALAICEVVPFFRPAFMIGLHLLNFTWFYAATRLVLGANWALSLGLFIAITIAGIILDVFVERTLGMIRL